MRTFFNFLLGLVFGALTGAAAALLLAPMPGDELRGQAQNRFDSAMTDIRTTIDEERKRLETELEAMKRGEIKIG